VKWVGEGVGEGWGEGWVLSSRVSVALTQSSAFFIFSGVKKKSSNRAIRSATSASNWVDYLLQYIYFPCKQDTKRRKGNFSEISFFEFLVLKCLRAKQKNASLFTTVRHEYGGRDAVTRS
jgi:hypothetical protein